MSGDGYDEWVSIDPAGRLRANPFRSPATRLQEHFERFNGHHVEIESRVLLASLYWAVPVLILAVLAGFLLGGWVGSF